MYLPLVKAVESDINRGHASDPELKDTIIIFTRRHAVDGPKSCLNFIRDKM
jgi:hypothetical protein